MVSITRVENSMARRCRRKYKQFAFAETVRNNNNNNMNEYE